MATRFKTILFDFDSTLYPHENGYERFVKENIYKFMVDRLGVPEDSVRQVHAELFAQTNQTLKALRTVGGFKFDIHEYFAATRTGADRFLTPDEGVTRLLEALGGYELVVFTNADEGSARTGLQLLGLDRFFKQVLGSVFLGEVCKPDHAAFHKVLEAVGSSAAQCVFFDDSLRNIKAAKELGITTVYVANRSTPRDVWDVQEVHECADYVVPFPTLVEVQRVFPDLLK